MLRRPKIYGIDAETSYAVSERWFVSGGVVWLPKREFVEYQNEETGDTLSGNELVRAPEWSANGAVGYERPLREFGSLSVKLEYSFRSGYFYTPENDAEFRPGQLRAAECVSQVRVGKREMVRICFRPQPDWTKIISIRCSSNPVRDTRIPTRLESAIGSESRRTSR